MHIILDALDVALAGKLNASTFDKLDYLLTKRVITWPHYKALEEAATYFLTIKIREHFRFSRQRIDISNDHQAKKYNRSIGGLYQLIDEKMRQNEIHQLKAELRISRTYCSFFKVDNHAKNTHLVSNHPTPSGGL
ncbi:MAG: hypothetical protein Q8R24_04105 [Legionellaceae bacterium]|nr:hypothetical protein [Legionellaceae bacterium]